ncbi:hypothetical protein [Pararhodobacter sp.]|nr:hypothetical protein [Pararhodobacter sp.]
MPLASESPSGFGYYFAEPELAVGQKPKRAVALFRDWLITEIDRETLV